MQHTWYSTCLFHRQTQRHKQTHRQEGANTHMHILYEQTTKNQTLALDPCTGPLLMASPLLIRPGHCQNRRLRCIITRWSFFSLCESCSSGPQINKLLTYFECYKTSVPCWGLFSFHISSVSSIDASHYNAKSVVPSHHFH